MTALPGACVPKDKAKRDVTLSVVAEISPRPGGGEQVRKIRPSKMGPWRAAVLIIVHVLIIAHVIQWWVSGMSDGIRETLSPVEPSESMFTLETGRINAGFVMFIAALTSTLLIGRFFCGWLCHIVALQDFCGWLMKKIGIHPKPWRVRLLLWAPLILAVYMFVWPTFRREVLIARWLWNDTNGNGLIELGEYPLGLGEIIPLHGFTQDFMVENFWQTFPVWYVAIPFLLICGFAIIYWLGAKAYCNYGCPYGGFFTPIDKFSPVRIRVNDDCNGCGHCTAVCTSNVRVHEEVRDFGAVVDPGCMKCLDCVSVCPNDALRVGVGKPAVLTKPRVEAEKVQKAAAARQKRWDLTWPEEIAIALVFLVLVLGYRSMYNSVPLLMAMGIAACGSFLVYKSWRLLRDRNVRGPFHQLKRDGKVTLTGWTFALLTIVVVAVGMQSLVMNYHLWRAEMIDGSIKTSRQTVFAPGYKPSEADKAAANEALRHLSFIRRIDAGGVSFFEQWGPSVRSSWLHAVAGDMPSAEAALERAMSLREPNAELVGGLMQFYAVRQAPPSEVEAKLSALLARWDGIEPVRRALAGVYFQTNQIDKAKSLFIDGLKQRPDDIATIRSAANLKLAVGEISAGVQILRDGLAKRPKSPDIKEDLAGMLLQENKADEALDLLNKAATHKPSFERYSKLAQLAEAMGKRSEAEAATKRARELELELADRTIVRAPRKEVFDRKVELLRLLGRESDARQAEGDRDRVLARLKARSEASRARHSG